ncbi:MAG: VOC family protein [Halieaceae bacterium]|nr:VOC family protein [Halieaceae bacterium]
MLIKERIIQNAYYVTQIDQAVERWHRLWGIGPFFVRRHIELENIMYRGLPSELEISAAYVQAGELMIELVTQHNKAPSIFREMYSAGEEGFHHVAIDFGDHERQIAHYHSLGFHSVTSFLTKEKRGATYLDTIAMLGHALEIYIVNDSLKALYSDVRKASENWDGQDLVIEL